MAQQFQEALIRKRRVLEMTGWSNSTLYARIAAGMFKPGVKVGPRMVAWVMAVSKPRSCPTSLMI